ncbi:MAG TPA: CoA-transferase [Methanomassiliicoccales archaeon]|jgi:glutaconate CoA-transferase subunit A|nr:CoA-transferase [Methanomassiliicoccales archaeon]
MGVFTQTNKLTTLKEAAAMVNDGDMVAIGGGLCLREPIGLIMELIRQGKRDLHLVGTAHGFDVDLCCGGGIVGAVEETHVSFEQDFGLALNYREACESGKVKVRESCCNTLINQLRAGSSGIPFIPLRSIKGSDELFMHPEYKVIDDPFTGKKIVLAPALTPDVAIVHVDKADPRGNLKILPPYVADVLFIRAANKVIVTAEEVVSEEEMKKIGPNIPYYETTAVVELPYGAHPTSCYPHYVYDREYISNYMKASREGPEAFKEKYLDKYVYGVESHEEYVKLIGEERFARLASWKESKERWMELFTYE